MAHLTKVLDSGHYLSRAECDIGRAEDNLNWEVKRDCDFRLGDILFITCLPSKHKDLSLAPHIR